MFGGIGWKIMVMARKAAVAVADAWPAFFMGNHGMGFNYSASGYPTLTQSESPIANFGGSSNNWKEIGVGARHRHAIRSDGTLWGVGGAVFRTLGDGGGVVRESPVQIGSLTDWTRLEVGVFGTAAQRSNGTIWGWGINYGANSPSMITGSDWSNAQFSSRGGKIVIIKPDGSLWVSANSSTNGQATALTPWQKNENPTQVGTGSWTDQMASTNTIRAALQTNGTLWVWGTRQAYGEHAGTLSSVPVQIGTTNTWSKLSGGNTHFLALRSNGTLWAWGNNAGGQLGTGNTISRSSPTQIGADTDWASLSVNRTSGTGVYFSVAIKTNGTLWAWGENGNGQLGLGNITSRSSPVQVGTDTNWANVSAGRRCTFAIKTNGTLWAWGNNGGGSLGLNDIIGRSSPVQVGTDTNWQKVFGGGGSYGAMAIKTTGTLWAWGTNGNGQLGIGGAGNISSPVQVGALSNWESAGTSIAGTAITFARNTDGRLWFAGNRNHWDGGRLQTGTQATLSPTLNNVGITGWTSFFARGAVHARKSDNSLWTWGVREIANNSSQYSAASGLTGWFGNSSAMPSSRAVALFGGATGDWSKVSSTYNNHTLFLKSNGTLWGFGRNNNGAIGAGSFYIGYAVSSPVQIGSLTGWTDISVSAVNSSFALRSNGTLWAWGANSWGQLGLGNTTLRNSPVQVGSSTDWAKLLRFSGSDSQSIQGAIKTNGTLWLWGRNYQGSCGRYGPYNASPRQIGSGTDWSGVYVTNNFCCLAKKTAGTLWSWGRNQSGELGQGNVTLLSSPVQIGSDANWGYAKITTNSAAVIFTKTNGTLFAWGANTSGQLGLGNLVNRSSPVQIGTDTNWSKVCSGQVFSMAIKTTGTLWAWGNNGSGQFGNNTVTSTSSPVQIGTDTNWKYVTNGYYSGGFTFAIKTTGTMWSWGRNSLGQLGTSNLLNRSSPVQVGTDTNWKNVFINGGNVWAVKTNGTLWAWGVNTSGVLGLGNSTSRSSPVQVGTATDWEAVFGADNRPNIILKKTNGTLWGCGLSNQGQLANRVMLISLSSPVQIDSSTNWSSASIGFSNPGVGLFLRTNGTIWHSGTRNFGCHGGSIPVDPVIAFSSPVQVGTDTNWRVVTGGGAGSYISFWGLKG